MCGSCGCDTEYSAHRAIQLEHDILAQNQKNAESNRSLFIAKNILAFNLMSSPGSGKTTLLTKTITSLKHKKNIAVIEGDQQTDFDAKKIAETGAKVLQINTGKSCHLDAHQIHHAITEMSLENNSILFIENVGNLVCPALFDLGETKKIVLISVTEGEDKPLKYPYMFHHAHLMVINKIDLLPYVDFDVNQCIAYAKRVNPVLEILQTSATKNIGIDAWCDWLVRQ